MRKALAAGTPLTRSAVVGPGQRGFLAAVLKPGTRAVTVQLESETRQAALIDPGDRVDVILTAGLRSADGPENVLTRTILEDVRVVAVDSLVGTATGTQEAEEPAQRGDVATATLEVLPAQAARLALGKHEGRLSLAVRSLVADSGARERGAAVNLRELLIPVPESPRTHRIFAAARPLPIGTLLDDEDLSELELERDAIRSGHILADEPLAADGLRGYAVRKAVAAGTPLLRSAVVGPGQRGFLAAVLKPGARAVSVQLESETRHAALIGPGDRVDVVLTAALKSVDGAENVLTRTVLEDVRVVAIDSLVGTATGMQEAEEPEQGGDVATATLEVLPAQAARLALGKHEGQLSLAVRSPADGFTTRGRGATVGLRELLTPVPLAAMTSDTESATEGLGQTRIEATVARKAVRVIRGDKVTEESFSDRQ